MGVTVAGKGDSGKRRKGSGFKAVGAEAAGILSPVLRKRGFAQIDLIQRWPQIVGPTLSDYCAPERLQWPRNPDLADGGTLHMVVAPGWATEVQHMAPMVIEKINRYFGWRAVSDLKLRQGAIKARPRKRPPKMRELTSDEQEQLDALVARVDDPGVKASLRRLGASIFAREGGQSD